MSLKVRLTLVMASTGILLVLGCLAGMLLMVFQHHITDLSRHQQTLLEELAGGIDNQLRTTLRALASVARITPVITTVDRVSAERFLENRTGIRSLFDNLISANLPLGANQESLSNVPWIVAANIPASEVFAPVLAGTTYAGVAQHCPVLFLHIS